MAGMAVVGLPEFLATVGVPAVTISAASGSRHGWQLGALEQALLPAVAAGVHAQVVFEIGTFDGGTSLAVAKALPAGATVHTIDLPDDAFDATQGPNDFRSRDVGRAFRDYHDPSSASIVQHRADTKTFDFSPWHRSVDLVLVDGAHDREHGLADSRTALDLVRPGGLVFWDDFEPYWHGLIDGIVTAVGAERLTKIARTSLAYFQAPG
jgi:predicted O-methyltransferase YrrM